MMNPASANIAGARPNHGFFNLSALFSFGKSAGRLAWLLPLSGMESAFGAENIYGPKSWVAPRNWGKDALLASPNAAGAGGGGAASAESAPHSAYDRGRVRAGVSGAAGHSVSGSVAPGQFGFQDVLDIINPLQHIPVVGSIYRAIAGDEIQPVSRVAGGGLYFGVLGAVAGVVTALVESQNDGEDPLTQLASNIFGPTTEAVAEGAAAASPPPEAVALALPPPAPFLNMTPQNVPAAMQAALDKYVAAQNFLSTPVKPQPDTLPPAGG